MTLFITILVLLMLLGLMVAISQPLELRENRWLKIGFSMPVLVVSAALFHMGSPGGAFLYGMCMMIIGIIWRSVVAWHGAQLLSRLIDDSSGGDGGFRPKFTHARGLMKDRNLIEALEELKRQICKEPTNYEGLLLLSEVHQRMGDAPESIAALETILSNDDATDGQKEHVAGRLKELKEWQASLPQA